MKNTCTVEDTDGLRCKGQAVGGGLCRKHYMRVKRTGTTGDPVRKQRGTCSFEGCGEPHVAKGLCRKHWWDKYQRPKYEAQRDAKRVERVRTIQAREPRDCAFCGKTLPLEKIRRGERSFCSRDCKEAERARSGRTAVAARKSRLKVFYGLTVEEVDAMAAEGCQICGTTDWPGRHARPHVDHDHKTGKVRGILCSECNTGLGKFKDDPALTQAATAYLERTSA